MQYKKVVEERIKKSEKIKDDEYYITDSGLLVFTEIYHTRRGYCCGLRCKHCPYTPKFQKGNTNI